jgi:hypothetical protein
MALIYVVFFVILSVLPVSAQQKASTGRVLVDEVIEVQAETGNVEATEQEQKASSNDNTFEQEVQAEVEKLKSSPTEKMVSAEARRRREAKVREEALKRVTKESDKDPFVRESRKRLQRNYNAYVSGVAKIQKNTAQANLTGPSCEGESASVVSDRVVQKRHLGVSMTIGVFNNTDLIWDIRVPTGRVGPAVRHLCPNSALELSFVLTSLFGGSGFTSSIRPTQVQRRTILVATAMNDGVTMSDQKEFYLYTGDYEVEKTDTWYLGDNARFPRSFKSQEVSPAPRRDTPRSVPAPRRPDVQEVMTIPRIPGF